MTTNFIKSHLDAVTPSAGGGGGDGVMMMLHTTGVPLATLALSLTLLCVCAGFAQQNGFKPRMPSLHFFRHRLLLSCAVPCIIVCAIMLIFTLD